MPNGQVVQQTGTENPGLKKNCNNRRLKGEQRFNCQTKGAVCFSVDNEI